jgi:hypothetical protein
MALICKAFFQRLRVRARFGLHVDELLPSEQEVARSKVTVMVGVSLDNPIYGNECQYS